MPNTLQRAWLILLVCFGAVTAGTAQSKADCCILEDSLARMGRLEAAHLARDVVSAQGGPRIDSIELPQDLVSTYYRAICAVRNEHSAVTDSLFSTLAFRYHPYASVEGLIISVDRAEPWYTKLRDSIFPTGYAPLDSLMRKYELEVNRIIPFDGTPVSPHVSFRSGRYLNMAALSRVFATLDGVQTASENGGIGDGDRLEGALFPGYVSLLYSIGSGDCPSGCTERTFYEFRVYPDCRVEFMGHNSSITSLRDRQAFWPRIYPNPFRNGFEVDLGAERTAVYALYASNGQLIERGSVEGNASITLPAGPRVIYFLKLQGSQLNVTKLLVRQ